MQLLRPRPPIHSSLLLSVISHSRPVRSERVDSQPTFGGPDNSPRDFHSRQWVYPRDTVHDQETHVRLIAVVQPPAGQSQLIVQYLALVQCKCVTQNDHKGALTYYPVPCHERSIQRDLGLSGDSVPKPFPSTQQSTAW